MGKLLRFAILATLFCTASWAQDAVEPLPEETAASFESLLEQINQQKEDVAILEVRAASREGVAADLLTARRDIMWSNMFRNTVSLARQVVAERDAGRDVSAYLDQVTADLELLPDEVQGMIQRVRERAEFATGELEVMDFVYADQEFFREVSTLNDLFTAMVAYIDVADDLGLDASADLEFTRTEVGDHAANLSVFLAIAQRKLDTLKASAATLPENAEIAEWLNAANERIRLTAAAMQRTVVQLDELELESRTYRQQLLTATGEITADVLDVGLVAGLIADWSRAAIDYTRANGPQLLFRILFVIVILFAFWQLGKLVERLLQKALASSRVKMSALLTDMIISIARNIVFAIGLMLAISQMGVSLGPLLAGLGIAGFIIGFALQDTLSNFASGVMILIYRPFDVGDYVEAGGVTGKVSHMSLVNTTFMTLDNQRLIVPNNMIWQTVITNVTAQRVRRVDLVFGVSYEDDLDKVEQILIEIVEAHEAVLESPEPNIRLHELADSSVNFIVRPWVKTDDYWDTYWDLTKAVKKRFDAEGISIPYPQRDVHVIEAPTPQA